MLLWKYCDCKRILIPIFNVLGLLMLITGFSIFHLWQNLIYKVWDWRYIMDLNAMSAGEQVQLYQLITENLHQSQTCTFLVWIMGFRKGCPVGESGRILLLDNFENWDPQKWDLQHSETKSVCYNILFFNFRGVQPTLPLPPVYPLQHFFDRDT